eukprot:9253933-Lingulodinium_polyedra.AAC.1
MPWLRSREATPTKARPARNTADAACATQPASAGSCSCLVNLRAAGGSAANKSVRTKAGTPRPPSRLAP